MTIKFFIKVFKRVKSKLKEEGLDDSIAPHFQYINSQFSELPIDQFTFENRVVDKFFVAPV